MSEIKIKEVMEEIYHKLQDGDTHLSEEQAETYREIGRVQRTKCRLNLEI